jgi:hypothetical protein
VEAASHLGRLRCCLTGTVGKRPTAIATHHFDLRPAVLLQPHGKGRRVSVGQEIEDAMLLQIHEDRAIVAAAAEGEIVDTERAQLRRDVSGSGDVRPTQESQQGIPARSILAQVQVSRESLPRLPTEREAHGFQSLA